MAHFTFLLLKRKLQSRDEELAEVNVIILVSLWCRNGLRLRCLNFVLSKVGHCLKLVQIQVEIRAVEVGFKNLGFFIFFLQKKLKT